MWEINSLLQTFAFLKAVAFGMLFCITLDFVRSVEGALKLNIFFTIVADILVSAAFSIITFCFLLSTTYGEIRFYVLLGIGIGFVLIRKTVSKFFLKFFVWIWDLISKIYQSIRRFAAKIVRKIYGFLKRIGNCVKIIKKRSKIEKKA